MVAAFVQGKSAYNGGLGDLSITLDATPTPGNLLVLWLAEREADGFPYGFSQGDWLFIGRANSGSLAFNNWPQRQWWLIVPSGMTASFTFSSWASSTGKHVIMGEWSGVNAFDRVVLLDNSGNDTVSITPGKANNVLVCTTFARTDGAGDNHNAVAGSTEYSNTGASGMPRGNGFYRLNNPATTSYTMGTSTNLPNNSSIICSSFIEVGAPPIRRAMQAVKRASEWFVRHDGIVVRERRVWVPGWAA